MKSEFCGFIFKFNIKVPESDMAQGTVLMADTVEDMAEDTVYCYI
jgi:hypothetical protein